MVNDDYDDNDDDNDNYDDDDDWHNDDNENDHDDDDDIYIMVECIYLSMSQKSLFSSSHQLDC